jgi:hypothetical protein
MPESIYRTNFQISHSQIPRTNKLHKNSNPQSAYAVHILHNIHEYSTINDTMTLLHPTQNTTLLLPYEQIFIHNHNNVTNLIHLHFHYHKHFIVS